MKALVIWMLGIGATIVCSPAHACDCVPNTLERYIQSADVILSGEFIQGKDLWELSKDGKGAPILYYTGSFAVTEVIKGKNIKAGDTLNVASDFANCSTLFKIGMNYLLFASLNKGNIKTDICSQSMRLDEDKTKKTLKEIKRLLRKRLST